MLSSLTLLLLFCVLVHACNARCLSIIVQETGKQCHLFTRDVDKAELHKSPIQLVPGHPVSKEEAKIFLKGEASEGVTSGRSIVHSPDDLQGLAKAEGLKKSQARWLLGSSADDTNEAVDTKEIDVVGDVVVMDYAQPHRKPPIHNEKP